MNSLLQIIDLKIEFKTPRSRLKALNGINLDVKPGEVFGIVGETGCGKTITGLSVLRLLPKTASISGKIFFKERDLLSLSGNEIESIRGREIAMIFQDPNSSLNPVFSIGEQITRVLRQHLHIDHREAIQRARETLEAVGLPDVNRVMASYPHQLSGGMQQRTMIAMALACRPDLLIADEPTTALDVTIQAQILRLLRDLQKKYNLAIVFITHNLGVVAQMCDRLAVFYAGRVVEVGATKDVFLNASHPYTKGLLAAIPRPGQRGHKLTSIPGTVPPNPGLLTGCPYSPRCSLAFERCGKEIPILYNLSETHFSACFLTDSDKVIR